MSDTLHIVPALVGQPFHVARDLAAERELAIAGLDPDGPPIGAVAWPGLWYITSQDPAEGTRLAAWESVRVTVEQHGNEDGQPAVVSPPPGSLSATAKRSEQYPEG